MRRTLMLAVSLCALVGLPAVAGASITDLYGYWAGTWHIDEMILSDSSMYGSPPYPAVDFGLLLTPYDAATSSYGVLDYGGAIAGDVVGLVLNGSNVSITINYAPYGTFPDNPVYYAAISGTLSNGTLTGNYDEPLPPPGWIGWRGPFEMNLDGKIPEPATICLLAISSLWVVWRRAVQP